MVSGCCGRPAFLGRVAAAPAGSVRAGQLRAGVRRRRPRALHAQLARRRDARRRPVRARGVARRLRDGAPLAAGRLLVVASVVALMVPVTALLVPRFTLFSWVGVTDTWIPLLAPALLDVAAVRAPLRVGVPAHPQRAVRRLPAAGPHAVSDLAAGRDAARAARDGGGRRARLPRLVGQRPRPARLPLRSRPLHPAARPALAGRRSTGRTCRSCSPAPSSRRRPVGCCSSWHSAGSFTNSEVHIGSLADHAVARARRPLCGRRLWRRGRLRGRRARPVPRLRRPRGAECVPQGHGRL